MLTHPPTPTAPRNQQCQELNHLELCKNDPPAINPIGMQAPYTQQMQMQPAAPPPPQAAPVININVGGPPQQYAPPPYGQPQGYPPQGGYAPPVGYSPQPGYAPQPYGQPQGYGASRSTREGCAPGLPLSRAMDCGSVFPREAIPRG